MGRAFSTYRGRGEAHTGFWWANLWEREHLGDPDIDGMIILRWIFRRWDGAAWTGLIRLRRGQVVGTCECSN
jgi:hypothetical protein